jgi:excisionase family DNA binding protein
MPRPAKPKGPGRPCKEVPRPTWAELDDILMVADVALYYGIDRSTLYSLIESGSCPFPVHRFGSAIRISKYELAGIPQDILEKALLQRDALRIGNELEQKAG